MKKQPDSRTAAICGLFCGTCPSYPKECEGCLSERTASDCTFCHNGFRDCAKAHGVVRCYECEEFPCQRLETFKGKHYCNGIGHHERVIQDLQYMKENTVEQWVQMQTQVHTCKNCGELIYWHDMQCHSCKHDLN